MLHALRVHQADSASKIHEWGPFVAWGLPSVQLPKELWKKPWDASVVKTAKLRAELCRKWLNENGDNTGWEKLMNLGILKQCNFLVSAYEYGCTFDDYSAMSEAILAVLKHLEVGIALMTLPPSLRPQVVPGMCRKGDMNIFHDTSFFKIIDQIFTLVPLDHLKKIEEELEGCNDLWTLYQFRCLMRYTQAMYGSAKEALLYADAVVDMSRISPVVHKSVNWQELGFDTPFSRGFGSPSPLEVARQERAVVLRLTGRHKEALQELDELLAPGDDHECLIQRSYLKHLMGDGDGALADARRAALAEAGSINYHVLAVHALPDTFRRRLSQP